MPYTPLSYNKYELPEIPEEQPSAASDFAYIATSAANKGLAGLARSADTVFGDGIDGEFINRLEANVEYGADKLSDRQKEANQKQFITDEGGFGDAWKDPRALMNVGASGLGSFAPMALGGGVLGTALKKGLSVAGAKGLAEVAGAASYGLVEGGMSGGMVAGDVQAVTNAMPDDVIAQSPRMQALFDENMEKGLDEDTAFQEARLQLGREAGVAAMKKDVPLSILFGTVAGRFLDNAVTGKLKGSRPQNAAVGSAVEGSTEAAQGGIEHYTTQEALAGIDPLIDPTKGLANAMVAEGLGGGMMGGAVGLAGKPVDKKYDGEIDQDSIDQGNKWVKPEFKDQPDAEKIVQNRTVDGVPVQQAIDGQYQSANITEDQIIPGQNPELENTQLRGTDDTRADDKPAKQNLDAGRTAGTDAAEFDAAGVQLPADNELRQPTEKPAEQFSQSTLSGAESLGDIGYDVLESAAKQNLTDEETLQVVNYLLDVKQTKETQADEKSQESKQDNQLTGLANAVQTQPEQAPRPVYEKPAFKIIPDAEKIVSNRTVKGIDLRQFIDSRDAKDSYNPLAGTYEKPEFSIKENARPDGRVKETEGGRGVFKASEGGQGFRPTHIDPVTSDEYQYLEGDQYADKSGEQWTFNQGELVEQTAKENAKAVNKDDNKVPEREPRKIPEYGSNNNLPGETALNEQEKTKSQETPVTAEPGKAELDEVLTQTKKQYVNKQLRAQKIRKASPGYDSAVARIESEYDVDVEKAQAKLTFEQYKSLPENDGQPDGVLKQVHEQLKSEYEKEAGQVKPVSPNARNDTKTDGMVDGGRQEGQPVSSYQKAGDVEVESIKVPAEFINRQKVEIDADGEIINADAKVLLKELNAQIKALESFIECAGG